MESDGIGLVSALITMTKLKAHLDFLDLEQATELVERFGKKKREKLLMLKASISSKAYSRLQIEAYFSSYKIFLFLRWILICES